MELTNAAQIQPDDLLLRNDPADAVSALGQEKKPADLNKLKEAAQKFEGLFVHQILKQMKETTAQLEPEDEESTDTSTSEHLKSMFWTFLADAVTEQGGFGLWEKVYEQMASRVESGQSANLVELDETI